MTTETRELVEHRDDHTLTKAQILRFLLATLQGWDDDTRIEVYSSWDPQYGGRVRLTATREIDDGTTA